MKLKKYYVAIFGIAFAIALAVQAPSTVLSAWLAHSTGGRLVLAEPKGTIWSGSATPVIELKAAAPLRLGRVTWDVSFRPLWHGVVLLHVQQSEGQQAHPAEILLRLSQVEFRDVAVELPAAAMGGLDPLLQAMRFQGRLVVSANSIIVGRDGAITGSAVADWEMAGSALSPVNPFGSYRMDLAGKGDQVKIALSTVSGCLQLSGQGQWRPGALEFQATAAGTGKSKEALSEMLHHLGPETAPGIFSFKLNR